MKRCVTSTLVFSVLVAIATTVSADGNGNNNSKNFNRFKGWGKSRGIADIVSQFKDHDDDDDDDDDDKPAEPGPGGGQNPPSNPTQPPQPPHRPGYVWVGDHWERERASSNKPVGPIVTDPLPGNIVVRDHRSPIVGTDSSNAPGGVTVTNTPIIRDHRTPTNAPIIRDHRTPAVAGGNGQGGVWVTETTGKPRPKGGSGGILGTLGDAASGIGDAVGSAGNAVGNAVGGAASTVGRGAGKVLNSAGNAVNGAVDSITPASGKPKPATTSGWTVVRDHR